jgi:hypothetical protein
VCCFTGLTLLGAQKAAAVGSRAVDKSEDELIVFEAFAGVGGARRALDVLGVTAAAYVNSKTSQEALRILKRKWPDGVELGDITKIADQQLRDLRSRVVRLRRGLLTGGFPCQGVSILNATRKGLGDARSALVWCLIELFARLKLIFFDVVWRFLFENAQSGPVDDVDVLSWVLGVEPIAVCSGDVTHTRRPRLYWVSFDMLQPWLDFCVGEGHWWKLRFCVDNVEPNWWLSPSSAMTKYSQVYSLRIAVRWIPRKGPPIRPAGVERLSLRTSGSTFSAGPSSCSA